MQRGGMHLTLAESKRGSLSRKSISVKLNIMPPDRTKEPMFHSVSVKRRKNFEECIILSNTAQGELSMGGFRKTFVNSLSTVGVQQRSQRTTRVASLWCDRLLVFIPQTWTVFTHCKTRLKLYCPKGRFNYWLAWWYAMCSLDRQGWVSLSQCAQGLHAVLSRAHSGRLTMKTFWIPNLHICVFERV